MTAGLVRDFDGTPITEPGIYLMTDDQYHADPCAVPSLSASLIKKAIPGGRSGGSARHMQFAHPRLNPDFKQESSNKFDLGSAFHALILGRGRELAVIDAADWRTKDAKAAREAAEQDGMQPILKGQYEAALGMVRAAKWEMSRWPELNMAMAGGSAERVYVWTEDSPSGPVWCRMKLDWEPHGGRYFPDWKTTAGGAGPDDYGRIMFDTGAHIQDAFYRRGIKAVLGRDAQLIFAAVETAEPHCMMVHAIQPSTQAMADRQVIWGINTFGMCLARGVWPGYPAEIAFQAAPPWIENKWIDREDQGLTGDDWTAKMIEGMAEIQKRPMGLDADFAADFDLASADDEKGAGHGV